MIDKICVGEIVGVHGIKGEVKVKSFTEIDRNLESYGILSDQYQHQLEIKITGHSKELLRVKIKGIDDRNKAKEFIGCRLYAARNALPELKSKDEFYQADLIGLNVRLENGQNVGEVVGIYNFGAGEILELKISADNHKEMIPFTHEYVPEININDGYIIVHSVSMIFDRDDDFVI